MNKAALAALALACAVIPACNAPEAAEAPLAGAAIGGPFTLTDQDGKRVTEATYAGKWRIYYFGYTYCPDVCPVDLQHLMQGLKLFEGKNPERGASIQPIFITIDPARDTPAAMKQYVGAFHPRLVGLTGSEAEVAAAAKAFAIYYKRAEKAGASDYLMDHARQAYLFDPAGKPVALLPQDEAPENIAAALDRWVK